MSFDIWRVAALTALALLAGCDRSRPAPSQSRAGQGEPVAPALPAPRPPATGSLFPGRFRIVVAPRETPGTFLLDTLTGHVWRLVQKTRLQGEPYVWEHMDRLDTNADDYVFGQEHQFPRRLPR